MKDLSGGGALGFDDPHQGFRDLFDHAPDDGADLRADWIDTPLGLMIAIADNDALHVLEFHDRTMLSHGLRRLSSMVSGRIGLGRGPVHARLTGQLRDYLAGRTDRLDVPVHLRGTDFQKQVWTALQAIPAGKTRSYGELARSIGRPSAVRAVAGANAANRLALIVPCHRVIGSNGTLVGYAGGMARKERLIALEQGRTRQDPA